MLKRKVSFTKRFTKFELSRYLFRIGKTENHSSLCSSETETEGEEIPLYTNE